jgi:hypothetical protein
LERNSLARERGFRRSRGRHEVGSIRLDLGRYGHQLRPRAHLSGAYNRPVTEPLWIVGFMGAEPNSDTPGAPECRRIQLTGSTGGGTVPPGGTFRPPDHHYVWVNSADERTAIARVREALEGYGAYTVLTAPARSTRCDTETFTDSERN